MKKVLFFAMFSMLTISLWAQSSEIAGSWLMVRAETNDGVREPYSITDFKPDGKMVIMGMPVGIWQFNKASNELILQSKVAKNFNGTGKIEKLNNKDLVVLINGVKMFYIKVDPNEISKNNSQLKVDGVWRGKDNDGKSVFLKFAAPDSLKVLTVGGGSVDKAQCSWIYNPKDKEMIIMGFSRLLRGKNTVSLEDNKLTLKNSNIELVAIKDESSKNIERLTFKEDDFPEEDENEPELPWGDIDNMADVLNGVKELKFTKGSLLNDINALNYKTLITKVKVDMEKPGVMFTNVYIENGDTMQHSQNYKGGLNEMYNKFFPLDELYPFRIVGHAPVKVKAGTFTCTVIEGIDGEDKVKLWMIDEMPGVYAKIIRESTDPFGDVSYSVKELTEIVRK